MKIFEYALMVLFTFIGFKYLFDMILFSLGYEINGKKRKPVIGKKKMRDAAKEARAREAFQRHYDWEKEFKTSGAA